VRSKSPTGSRVQLSLKKSRSLSPKLDLISPTNSSMAKRNTSLDKFRKKGELTSAKESATKVRESESKLEAERRLREHKIKKIVKKSKTNTGKSNGDTDTPKFMIKSQASAKPNGKPLRVSSVKKLTKKGNVDDDSWTEHRNLKHDGKSSSNGFNKNDYSSGSIRKKML